MLFRLFEKLVDPFADEALTKPPSSLLPFIWHYAKPFKGLLIAVAITSASVGLIEVLAFEFVGRVVDWMNASNGAADFWEIHGLNVILICVGLAIIWPLLTLLDDFIHLQGIISPFAMGIRWRGHRYLLRQSTSFFASDYAGRVTTKLMQTALGVREVMQKITGLFAYMAVYFIGALVMFAGADLRLSIPIVMWLVLYAVMMRVLLPKMAKWSARSADERSILTGRIVDAYTNIQTVKLFSSNQAEESYARESMDKTLTVFSHQFRVATILSLCLHSLNAVLVTTTIGLGVWLWSVGSVSVGAVALAGALVLRIQGLSHYFLWELSGLFENIGSVQDGMGTLAKPISVIDAPDAKQLNVPKGEIAFRDVGFTYAEGKSIMEGLSLTVSPGERVGLVGRSGAGKSTLMNLLLRMYDVQSGQIEIDGQDIAAVTQESLRHHIGVVTQDTSLLHRSVRENIAYGRPDATEEEIIAAAEQAAAWDFIPDLADEKGQRGLDALVGERGVKLSGGQRQRIAIARVILKNAPILLLDEATSALDSEVEAAIQSQLDGLMAGKTVIAIAHRLSTIAAMDRLIVMNEGRIIEEGTHAELIDQRGIYADLWARQSGGFINTEDGVATG